MAQAKVAPLHRISQSEIESYLLAKRKVDQLKESIRQQLQAGYAVEDGVHTAKLIEVEQRRVNWKGVVERLQGAAYVRRVTAATKPSVSARLLVQ